MIPYANEKESTIQDDEYNQKVVNKVNVYNKVLLNRPSKAVAVVVLIAVITPIILYQFLFHTTLDFPPSDGYSFGSCLLPRETRLPCGYGDVSESQCHPQCCYDLNNGFCFHRLPSRFSYIMDREWSEDVDLHPRVATEPFSLQPSLAHLRLSVDEVSETHLSLTLYDARATSIANGRRLDAKNYTYVVSSPEFNLEVMSSDNVIFNTIRGPLIASNNIWELSFRLTNNTMFGLGEIPLESGTVKVIHSHRGGLSSVPLVYAKSNDSYHGVLIESDSPTEVRIENENVVLLRSLTTSMLKLHVFVGPRPEHIMNDVAKLIGHQSNLEYWMLGAHLCNGEIDSSTEALQNLTEFLANAREENLPFESHCGAGPVGLSYEPKDNLTHWDEVASILKSQGIRVVPHLSPYVIIDHVNATENITRTALDIQDYEELFLMDSSGLYRGKAGDAAVAYPDYRNNRTKEMLRLLWPFNTSVDGLILVNNWPLDEAIKALNETHLYLPYFNEFFERAFAETPAWNSSFANRSLYLHAHNRYGNDFYEAVKEVTGLPLSTSSQWMNGEGVVNRQGIDASWSNLRRELLEASLGGISGNWLWSSPVCGDTDTFDADTQQELCIEWYAASAYLPILNVHSTSKQRHPLAFSGMERKRIKDTLTQRLSLLPYIFTVLQTGPLLRPMFYQFPHSELEGLSTQFAVGADLVVVPVLLPGQSHVNVWVPPGDWFELWGGLRMQSDRPVPVSVTEGDVVTLVRGGAVLFLQRDTRTTAVETRKNSSYSLIVALNCYTYGSVLNPQYACEASGTLYITDNMTIRATADSDKITITAEGDDFDSICGEDAVSNSLIATLTVYGLEEEMFNHDNHKLVEANVGLCNLQMSSEINVVF